MATKTRTATITDIGRQYAARNQNRLIHSRGSWWAWNGQVWERAHEQTQSREFWKLLEEFQAKDGQKPTYHKKRSIEDYCESKLFVPGEQLDAYPSLINLQNGVFNLEDGNLYPHDPDYYLTTILPFDYDPEARMEMFKMYLMTTFVKPRTHDPDPELAEFVQEAVGYSLTTDVSQHAMFWCIGEGANGKGVLFHVLEQLGGNATTALNVGLLKREQYQLAMLPGKRIALCSEASATSNLVEDALVKALVAGDSMMVRQIRKKPFELHPKAKLWWSMNELPAVADTSEGFWRRMCVIPFNRGFSKDEQILDLKEKLERELSGIFNWAMAGLRRLRDRGHFPMPHQVEEATTRYRQESNPILLFVQEKCKTGKQYEVQSSDIYSEYSNWCHDNGFRRQSIKNFKKEMGRLDYYTRHARTGTVYEGIDLKQQVWPAP